MLVVKRGVFVGVGLLLLGLVLDAPQAGRISDIRNTTHNLSASGPGTTRATSESQICVFCHTPHAAKTAAELGLAAPLWNRQLSSAATYTMYDSSSIDATDMAGEPGGTSKLCLSCHDGTVALGAVGVLNGQSNPLIDMQASDPDFDGTMPGGRLSNNDPAVTSGYTRRLGVDLRNDHPISFTYDSSLAAADRELRDPASDTVTSANAALDGSLHIRSRMPGDTRPLMPLDAGQLQCTTCHDPHIRDAGVYEGQEINAKFLRINRFQLSTLSVLPNPAQITGPFTNFVFNPAGPGNPLGPDSGDIICLACHDKAGWAQSAHAREDVANYTYANAAIEGANPTQLRDFFPGIRVWQAACLNCHDTHTVQGSRRLLREGIGGVGIDRGTGNRNQALIGGNADQSDSAVENTCFQCHSNDRQTLVGQSLVGFGVPNIKSDFELNYHMPILTQDQENTGREVHGILDADFYEPPASLASMSQQPAGGRHAECTDCHNPHRVKRTRYFWEDPDIAGANTDQPTHTHDAGVLHTNLASGVLAGAYGVEPDYGTAEWEPDPLNWASQGYYRDDDVGNVFTFTELKGAPPLDSRNSPPAETDPLINRNTATYVTREYQICMKCHSHFGYGSEPPTLRPLANGGSLNENGFTTSVPETNQAMEFMAPDGSTKYGGASHLAEGTATGSNWGVESTTDNHRSWHPVVGPTGRTGTIRGPGGTDISGNWYPPFNAGVGTQTMYCSDCHGSDTPNGGSAPAGNNPWGPHGSDNPFILKGPWTPSNTDTPADALCFKCHNTGYRSGTQGDSGFHDDNNFGSKKGDLHLYHADKIQANSGAGRDMLRCNWCHTAVPHGWKNKAFLVNLNDVGPECEENGTRLAVGTDRNPGNNGFTCDPYYRNAYLRVINWRRSGEWRPQDCGVDSNDNDVDWMRNTCQNPP